MAKRQTLIIKMIKGIMTKAKAINKAKVTNNNQAISKAMATTMMVVITRQTAKRLTNKRAITKPTRAIKMNTMTDSTTTKALRMVSNRLRMATERDRNGVVMIPKKIRRPSVTSP